MYEADGIRVVIVKGHTMVGCANSTSVLITTVYVEIAELGILMVMSMRPAGVVSKTPVEHGSLIMTSNFASTYLLSTVAIKVCE